MRLDIHTCKHVCIYMHVYVYGHVDYIRHMDGGPLLGAYRG